LSNIRVHRRLKNETPITHQLSLITSSEVPIDMKRGKRSRVVARTRMKTLSPAGAIRPTGTWSLGTRAGGFVFVAGMRGIDPKTNALVRGAEARTMQAFRNMKLVAESEGATLRDAVRLVVYVTDMNRLRPIVNRVQAKLWGKNRYPPRSIVEVAGLNQDDIVEVEGTFYAPLSRRRKKDEG